MSLGPDRWEALARAALRNVVDERHWLFDEMVAAAVERIATLHAADELPARPSVVGAIARYAGIDELRRLERNAAQYAKGERPALSLDALVSPSGDPVQFVDEGAHEFPDQIAEQLLAATRAGRIMGAQLSRRERQVLLLAATGETQAGIADRMGVSQSNVCLYLNKIATRFAHLTT